MDQLTNQGQNLEVLPRGEAGSSSSAAPVTAPTSHVVNTIEIIDSEEKMITICENPRFFRRQSSWVVIPLVFSFGKKNVCFENEF